MDIDKIKEYLKQKYFEVNENGIYAYQSTNGVSHINLPYVILEIATELSSTQYIQTITKLEKELKAKENYIKVIESDVRVEENKNKEVHKDKLSYSNQWEFVSKENTELKKRVEELKNDKVLIKDDILMLVNSGGVLEDFENYFNSNY